METPRKPIGYLIRVADLDQVFPLLADKPLSAEGIQQSHAIAQFFSLEPYKTLRVPLMAAPQHMAEIIEQAARKSSDAPDAFIVCEEHPSFMGVVGPGGIIAVFENDVYEARLNPIDIGKLD